MAESFDGLVHFPAQRMALRILSGHPIVAGYAFRHPEESSAELLLWLLIFAPDEFLLTSVNGESADRLLGHEDEEVAEMAWARLKPLMDQLDGRSGAAHDGSGGRPFQAARDG